MKKLLTVTIIPILLLFQLSSADTWYVSPDGGGDGSSETSPLGSLSSAQNGLSPGDTLILLDGEYLEPLDITKLGSEGQPITIMAQNVGKAFINGSGSHIPVSAWQKSWINLDGLRAGNSSEHVYHILYCDNFVITRCAGFDAGGALDPDANFHIFEIAYSTDFLCEDVWGWGTGRYSFVYYGCSRCHIRRGVFKPGLYCRCPHAGLAIYCTDSSLVENVIVFNCRVDPASGYGGTEPWKLITGGFVCEGHDCPDNKSSRGNRLYGCIGIDNGEHWDVTPRSQPAGCFIWNEFQGEFEDWVLWKNPDKAFAEFTEPGVSILPARSLEGDPDNVISNTGPGILDRYVDGELTDISLWPWPYEEIIREDFGMEETVTEYVRSQLDPFIVLPNTGVIEGAGHHPRPILPGADDLPGQPVRIYSVNGRLIMSTEKYFIGKISEYKTSTLPCGVYIVRIGKQSIKYVINIIR